MLQVLRALGRLDGSVILVHSDHGHGADPDGDEKPEFWPDVEIHDRIRKAMQYVPTEEFFRRLRSLLLIKPPQAGATPLSESRTATQLADIPATLYDLLEIEGETGVGAPVFRLDEAQSREIHVYAGIYSKDSRGRDVNLWRGMPTNQLAHLSYLEGRGWIAHPEITATYDP